VKVINEERIEKILKIVSIFIIVCFCALLFPQVRKLIVEVGEKVLGRDLSVYMKVLFTNSLFIILLFGVFLTLLLQKNKTIYIQDFINKHGKRFLYLFQPELLQ